MLKLFRLLQPYLPHILLVILLLFGSALADLLLPALMARIVDQGIVTNNLPSIYQTGGFMLAVSAVGMLCSLVSAYFSARIALGFSQILRRRVFQRAEDFSFREFDRIGTASLITRTTQDVHQVQQALIMLLGVLVRAPIMGLGGLVMAVATDPRLSLVFFLSVPLLGLALGVIAAAGVPLFRALQTKLDRLNLVIREKLTGLRVVRAFDRVGYEAERFQAANADLTATGLKLARWMTVLMPLMMILMNLTVIAIVWFGSQRAGAGQLQVGGIMAFIQYALMILFSLMLLSMLFIVLPRAQVSAGRINEVLELEPEIRSPAGAASPGSGLAEVVFENVSFTYPGAEEPAVSGVSFTARPGQVTAIIGSTGSGKTTLVNLLPRFYDPQAGRILVAGVDIRSMALTGLRQRIGFVPQKTMLFSATLRENLAFGQAGLSDAELGRAAEIAQAMAFIAEQPEGWETRLAQAGANLSGGQKQRLAIARALARQAAIYVFDDSFSALDYQTDAHLRQALKTATRAATVLLVAQRVTSVMDADQIVVLEDGRVVGLGRHQDLMAACRVYREIVDSQLSQEELA